MAKEERSPEPRAKRFLRIGDGIAEAMLAHADFRHGRISRLRGKIRIVQRERFIQRLLRQLKVFHIARFPGALKKGGSQGRISSRIFGIALHPACMV